MSTYGYGHGPNQGVMEGQYYGGGGYDGTQQMAQSYQGGDNTGGYGSGGWEQRGNYMCGGFDQGKAEASRAFPPFQGESLQESVDRAFPDQRGADDWREPGQYSQTDRRAEEEAGARGTAAFRGGGLYTAENHREMTKRREGVHSGQNTHSGRGVQKGQNTPTSGSGGLVTKAQREENKRGGGVTNATLSPATCEGGGVTPIKEDTRKRIEYLTSHPQQQGAAEASGAVGRGANPRGATGGIHASHASDITMGGLGPGQIHYNDLNPDQKIVRDYCINKMLERERKGRTTAATAVGPLPVQRNPRGGRGRGLPYEHPHSKGRGRGAKGKGAHTEPTMDSVDADIQKLMEQRKAMQKSANRSMLLGDEDGPEDRLEEEMTDAQANAGEDELMAQVQGAVRAVTAQPGSTLYPPGEMHPNCHTPGGAETGGVASGSSEEPAAKRMHTEEGGIQTMEDVETAAGVAPPKIKRGALLPTEAEVKRRMEGKGGSATPWRGGYLAKRAAAKRVVASASGGGEKPGGAELPAPKRMNPAMPPPPAMAPTGGKAKEFALPQAVTTESGIPSGSEHTVESVPQEETARREQMEVEAAAATPTPVGGKGSETGDSMDQDGPEQEAATMEAAPPQGAGQPPPLEAAPKAHVPVEPTPEPQAEELVGEKCKQRDEMWANVSVAMQMQGESTRMDHHMFGILIEAENGSDGTSSLESGSDGDKEEQLERDLEEQRQEGFPQHEPMAQTEMEELYALTKDQMHTEGEMPMAAGSSGKLPGEEGVTTMPLMAGLSVELPKKNEGDEDGEAERAETETQEATAAAATEEAAAQTADEDGEGDRAAEEKQEAGGMTLRSKIADMIEVWGRGTITPTVEMLDLRNAGSGEGKLDLTNHGGGRGITWNVAMARLRSAAEQGKLDVVLNAMDALWDTVGPVPVLREWLGEVWREHTREEEDELQDMERGDEEEQEEAKKRRESTQYKYGRERDYLCWSGMEGETGHWPRAIGMALVRITVVWGELGAEATWKNAQIAQIIAMGMELEGIAWRADGTDTEEALACVRAVASRGEQYRRTDEAHGELVKKVRERMASGELEGETAAEMGKCAGAAIYARRMGMAMVAMCASQYPTVESNEALGTIAKELEREIERVGGILLMVAGNETRKEAWRTAMDRRVGADLSTYDTWFTAETKLAEAGRREIQEKLRAAQQEAARDLRVAAMAKAERERVMEEERKEREKERRKPSLNVVIHLENGNGERGHTAVNDLETLCGQDAVDSPADCAEGIAEEVVEAMMMVATQWGFDTVVLTPSTDGWKQFPPKHGRRAECGLKINVTADDPLHMVEYMRRVNDVKMNAGVMEVTREGEDGQWWTRRAQLRTDWGSAELRAEMAPVTWDKWQLEVDMGQLKAMEVVPHVSTLVEKLGDERLVREMAGRIFERVTAVFPSGDSFKTKRGGEQYAKYRAEGTGLALSVEREGHLPVCGVVKSGHGDMETVISIAYAVMRAHEQMKGHCVNCHTEPRTKDGNDHECDSYRDCSARVWNGMQELKRTPAMVRVRTHQQANNRGGRNANRRDKAKMGGQGSRNATHEW